MFQGPSLLGAQMAAFSGHPVAQATEAPLASPCHVLHSFHRSKDTLAEWPRRRPAKPMGSPRVASNPRGVALWKLLAVSWKKG